MTPRRFGLLVERHNERQKREDLRAGIEWKEEETMAYTDDQMFDAMVRFKQQREGPEP